MQSLNISIKPVAKPNETKYCIFLSIYITCMFYFKFFNFIIGKSFTYTLSYGIKNIHLYSCTIVLILRLEFQTF